MSICLREKDHVDNLLQESLAECDRLAALSDRGLQPLVDDLELQCSRKIESYGRSIAALNTEVNRGKLQLNEKQQRVYRFPPNIRCDVNFRTMALAKRMAQLS